MLEDLPIHENLPHFFRPSEGEPVPEELIGATIVRIGTPTTPHFKDGGLVIDFTRPGESQVRRVIFEFDEITMSVWEPIPNLSDPGWFEVPDDGSDGLQNRRNLETLK